MTSRYEGDQSTGIYVRRYWKVTSKGFTIGPSPNLKTRLADLKRQVRHVLTKLKVKTSRKTGWPKGKSDFPLSAKPIVIDAVAILFRVEAVRRWVDKNHAENAALEAIILGRTVERVSVRPFEKWVARGRKDHADRQRGATKRFGTPEQKQKRWDTYRREYDLMRAKNPSLTRNCVAGRVAPKLNVSIQTILRHTKKLQQS